MDERTALKEYLLRWRELTPILRALKDEDIRRAETWSAIRAFDGIFEAAVRDLPPRESSGLVDFQDRLSRRSR